MVSTAESRSPRWSKDLHRRARISTVKSASPPQSQHVQGGVRISITESGSPGRSQRLQDGVSVSKTEQGSPRQSQRLWHGVGISIAESAASPAAAIGGHFRAVARVGENKACIGSQGRCEADTGWVVPTQSARPLVSCCEVAPVEPGKPGESSVRRPPLAAVLHGEGCEVGVGGVRAANAGS
jgi:hypothetical protein